jgi:hypothetical protein
MSGRPVFNVFKGRAPLKGRVPAHHHKLYTRGPFGELFGRKPVQNWSVVGNDARLWAEQMEVTA